MLHFDSKKFLDDGDESFVSIDLNDDLEECDICHQSTDESIVHVVLSDEFLRFEGSIAERHSGSITRAHQICLDKWCEIIERNLKSFKETENTTISTQNYQTTTQKKDGEDCFSKISELKSSSRTMYDKKPKHMMSMYYRQETKLMLPDLISMDVHLLKEIVSSLELKVRDASNDLVVELQNRDQLHQELSGQNTMIAQLVKLQTPPTPSRISRCSSPKKQTSQKLSILV